MCACGKKARAVWELHRHAQAWARRSDFHLAMKFQHGYWNSQINMAAKPHVNTCMTRYLSKQDCNWILILQEKFSVLPGCICTNVYMILSALSWCNLDTSHICIESPLYLILKKKTCLCHVTLCAKAMWHLQFLAGIFLSLQTPGLLCFKEDCWQYHFGESEGQMWKLLPKLWKVSAEEAETTLAF